jgi:hypothetical protein
MSKYTKGPWTAHPYNQRMGSLISFGDLTKGENIAAVFAQKNPEEGKANAQLVVCAPEMAMMLLSMFSHVSHGGPTRSEAEALLRKAWVL